MATERAGPCSALRAIAVLGALLSAGPIQSASAAPSVYATGVTRYDPQAAYNCDVLFSAADHLTYLIDMNGNVVHRWNHEGFPSKMLDPALMNGARGVVGLQLAAVPQGPGDAEIGLVPGQAAEFRNKSFGFVDWEGRILWQWGGAQAPGGAALQHHDWVRLANGHTLILADRSVVIAGFGDRKMLDDVIYEVDAGGNIVWRWMAADHLSEFGFTAAQLRLLKTDVSARDYLHLNDMEVLGPNHWEAGGDARFAADNILISSRNANFIAIISHSTGQVVWHLGPNLPHPVQYYGAPLGTRRAVPYPVDQFSGQHDANMIAEGLPGAGNILLFDNEGAGGYPPATTPLISGSRLLEIDPVKRLVVWDYTGTKFTFYSPYISSVQRLPNGNTLVDEGIDGRFFQVTPAGRIVWEYVSPFVPAPPPRAAAAGEGSPGSAAAARGRRSPPPIDYAVYRIQAVPYDWVPLAGPHSQIGVQPPPRASYHVDTAH